MSEQNNPETFDNEQLRIESKGWAGCRLAFILVAIVGCGLLSYLLLGHFVVLVSYLLDV